MISAGRRRVIILATLALGLAVQGIYALGASREPYPAVRMPGFGSAPSSDRLFATTTIDITIGYTDGSVRHPHLVKLMGDFRFSAVTTSADHVFHPRNNQGVVRPADDPEVRAWLAERARDIGDGTAPIYVEFCWRNGQLNVSSAQIIKSQACEMQRVNL